MPHTFELSGLGSAPFHVIASDNGACDGVFWCEHCGTGLKNRYFIKSSDNKISVVGIDCLRKSGDAGLIEAEKRLRTDQRNQNKQTQYEQQRLASEVKEREQNDGKTNAELASELESSLEDRMNAFTCQLDEIPVISLLTGSGFETSMAQRAYCLAPYTEGMLRAITEIVTKKRSGARKNSKSYLAAQDAARDDVNALAKIVLVESQEVEQVRKQILSLKFG